MSPCDVLPFADQPGRCDHCGKQLTGRQQRWCNGPCQDIGYENHRWTEARWAATKRDGNRCVREDCETPRRAIEVNHIEPRNGGGYGWGCWNHQANLETLCHAHHVAVTTQQIRDRKQQPPPAEPDLFGGAA